MALQNIQNWFVDKSQNLQNWNPEIWNIFPQNLQNWFVDRYITQKDSHGPIWLHMALFIMALLSILELNLFSFFLLSYPFLQMLFSVLHSDKLVPQVHMGPPQKGPRGPTWLHIALFIMALLSILELNLFSFFLLSSPFLQMLF